MADLVSVVSAAIVSGDLIIGLSDGGIINAGRVQGPQGLEGPIGPIGANGFAGHDGNTIRTSQGRPAADLGNEGDFAINTVDIEIFGPKMNNGWGNGTSLRGRVSEAEKEYKRGDERELFGMAPVNPDPMSAIGVTAPIINTGTETTPIIGIATELPGTVLAGVATTGDYNDLTNKPAPFDPNTLATVATTGEYSDLLSKPTLGTAAATDATAYATAAQGTTADSAVQPGDLSTVATSGNYADLSNKPDLSLKADLVNGKLDPLQVPDLAISEYLGEVASEAAMLALTGEEGDWAVRTDNGQVYIITGDDPSDAADWIALSYPASPVSSVAGRTGDVVLSNVDISGLGTAATTAATAYATAAQGALAASSVQSVSVTSPIVNTGTATDLTLELATIEGGTY